MANTPSKVNECFKSTPKLQWSSSNQDPEVAHLKTLLQRNRKFQSRWAWKEELIKRYINLQTKHVENITETSQWSNSTEETNTVHIYMKQNKHRSVFLSGFSSVPEVQSSLTSFHLSVQQIRSKCFKGVLLCKSNVWALTVCYRRRNHFKVTNNVMNQ